jgi:hypothetical protein
MGTGKAARERRIVYQYSFKRAAKRDNCTINLMIDKAERIADGKVPLKKARFLKVTGAQKALDQSTIDRARQLAGLKGYVTILPETKMPGAAVISAYHDLWQVEASFRMTKSDLRALPVFHRQREAIEAHLTVVFAALAIARHLQDTTGVTIKGSCAHSSPCAPSPSASAPRPSPPPQPSAWMPGPSSTGYHQSTHPGTKPVQVGPKRATLAARRKGLLPAYLS